MQAHQHTQKKKNRETLDHYSNIILLYLHCNSKIKTKSQLDQLFQYYSFISPLQL
jgi:hypothetical protein